MKREHYSVNAERAYSERIKQFVKFHYLQARESLFVEAENKVEKFLTYLATERDVSASTQNQAFNALVFLQDLETTMIYTHVLKKGGEGVESPLDDL